MKVIYATIEPCSENSDGDSCTLYFDSSDGLLEDVDLAFKNFAAYFHQFQAGSPNISPIGDMWHAPNALSKNRWQAMSG